MINRLLIRIKTVQLVYAFMQGSIDKLNSNEQMAQSLESSYQLYNYLLGLVVKLTEYRQTQLEAARKKFMPTQEERFPNVRFAENRVARCIAEKSEILDYCEKHSLLSDFDTEMYRGLLEEIEKLPGYKKFMTQREQPTLDDEKELWKDIFAEVISRNAMLDATLESRNIYWNDDLATVMQFVVKAINKLDPEKDQMSVAPMFDRNDDSKFARDLYNYALEDAHENLLLIDKNADNWQVDRMALMDKVIMVCALAEIKHFPEIAIRISMNEYIELAKHYCAPDSARFVNGILDKIIKQWKKDGVIFKA